MRATCLYPELAEKLEGLGRRGQVLMGIWAGKGTKEIAAEMGISPKTVEYHRARLYGVFGVNDLVSLCRRAIAVGLINPGSEEGMPEAVRDASRTHCSRICEATRSEASRPALRARGRSEHARNRAI
ncbi:MAG TPA: LuxR C-terminal-related transcriptional regulator [Candidatus Paceibacterota bacterium]|nr:LuxR C-terminal-related transcriptional regulator [Verrucomicrobiota bacterium]HSA10579.1 LuxR C-terminal-related transcriptional regulator [Candidatus Paceibacterota bacterium]